MSRRRTAPPPGRSPARSRSVPPPARPAARPSARWPDRQPVHREHRAQDQLTRVVVSSTWMSSDASGSSGNRRNPSHPTPANVPNGDLVTHVLDIENVGDQIGGGRMKVMATVTTASSRSDGPLAGRVAIVAGATRGAGRGIAVALGEAGATVVCTGRSSRRARCRPTTSGGPRRSRRPPSSSTRRVAPASRSPSTTSTPSRWPRLADRIDTDHGRIDVLVNDIWGGERLKGGPADWDTPIWERDLDDGLRLLRLAVDTHLITAHHAAPTARSTARRPARGAHRRHQRLQRRALPDLGLLRPRQGRRQPTRLLVRPRAGAVRGDRGRAHPGLDALGADARGVRHHRSGLAPPTAAPPGFAASESPRFVGRAVAAIAADPDRARWNQQSVTAGALAADYGFTDIDGTRPDAWRYMADTERGDAGDAADYR